MCLRNAGARGIAPFHNPVLECGKEVLPALEAAVSKVELRVGGVLAPLELERDDRELVDGFKVVLLVEQGLRPLESFVGGERRGLLSRAAAGGKYCRDEEDQRKEYFHHVICS